MSPDRSRDFFCMLMGSAVVEEGFTINAPQPVSGIQTFGYGSTIMAAEADARRQLAARPRPTDAEYAVALQNPLRGLRRAEDWR